MCKGRVQLFDFFPIMRIIFKVFYSLNQDNFVLVTFVMITIFLTLLFLKIFLPIFIEIMRSSVALPQHYHAGLEERINAKLDSFLFLASTPFFPLFYHYTPISPTYRGAVASSS